MKPILSSRLRWVLATVAVALCGLFLISTPGHGAPPAPPPFAQMFGLPGSTINPAGSVGKPETTDPFRPFPDLDLPGRGVAYPSSRAGNSPGLLVNTATGNLYLSYTDLVFPGRGFPFRFTRSYNSLDPYSGPLGLGWTHSYNLFLVEDPGTGAVVIKEADGHQLVFTPKFAGFYLASTAGSFDILQKGASFVLTRHNQTQFTFNLAGKLTRITDRNGNHQDLAYTPAGDLATVTDTSGRQFSFTYNASHHLTSLTDPTQRVYTFSYNAVESLSFSQDALGQQSAYTYTGGKLATFVDPRQVTALQVFYDPAGRVGQWLDANRAPVSFSYSNSSSNSSAAVTSFTDRRGNVTMHVHDSGLRLIQVTDALNGVTRYQYDANNERTTVVNALGNTTSYTYDGRGNRTSITDPLGDVTSFTYDSKDNLVTRTTPLGFTTTFAYDANGNRTSVRDPLGNTLQRGYDAFGDLTAAIDQNGHATRYSYDPNGRLMSVTDARGNVTHYLYDAAGNQQEFENANGAASTYSYDALNRLVSSQDPFGHVVQDGYDGTGHLNATRDAIGDTTQFSYTATGHVSRIDRLTPRGAPAPSAAYSYDANGNRLVMDDLSGHVTTYTYDALNRVTSIAQPSFAPPSPVPPPVPRTAISSRALLPGLRTVSYSYDAVGNRTQLTYPDGKTVRYSYDKANRLVTVTDWQSLITSYSYDKDGHNTGIAYPNGTSTAILWDSAGRLVTVRNVTLGPSGPVPTIFKYVLDPAGNRIRATDALGALTTYTYDEINELVSTQNSNGTTVYEYDAVGNRIKRTLPNGLVTSYTYDVRDHLQSAGPETYNYDANGNQIRKVINAPVNYTFDERNRLLSVSGVGVDESFIYDADGNLVVKTSGLITTEYINDISGPVVVALQELSVTAGTTTSFVLGKGTTIISEFNDAQGSKLYHHLDALGSTVGISNSSGRLAQIGLFDGWGDTSAGPGLTGEFQYLGERFNSGSGLYYLRARFYDRRLGRFISQDPYTGQSILPLSKNRYIYARNNPMRYTDRLGLDGDDDTADNTVDPSGNAVDPSSTPPDNAFDPLGDPPATFPLSPPSFDPQF